MTTILDLADQLGARDGFDVPSPRWRAVLAFFDGLPLSDADVAELAAATRRTPEAILSRSGRPFSELWCRVGRRGRKSSTAALIALREACFGGHDAHLMPSERGLVAVVSRDIAGSTVVARMLESFANALGISCRWTSMGSVRLLELDGFSFAVACLPCSATAPRGYAIAVVICDEIAHWQTDGDVYTDSDAAVLGAIRPAMAQFPRARLVAISSPLGHEGVFHSTVEASLGADGPDDVLMVGGSTLLPGVFPYFEDRFGRDRVRAWHPFHAVVTGVSATFWGSGISALRSTACELPSEKLSVTRDGALPFFSRSGVEHIPLQTESAEIRVGASKEKRSVSPVAG